MQKILLAALFIGAGYFAWSEYGSGPGFATSSLGTGGAGFSSFGKAASNVAAGAKDAVR